MIEPRIISKSEYELILSRLITGMSVQSACDGICHVQDLHSTLNQNDDLMTRFRNTLQFRASLHISELIEVADTELDPYRAKVRIDARKFYAERLDPERYGNRFDMKVTHEVSIQAALTEAKQRAEISLNDTQYKNVTQSVDIIKQALENKSDNESDTEDEIDYILS